MSDNLGISDRQLSGGQGLIVTVQTRQLGRGFGGKNKVITE
ncbi:hypothetical protein NON20_13215 [Synechocystis sp. B12]|nr:hypothetical protein NON20_13215 [Synechocystis sp. B12]